ncbi:MAG: thiosulfate oxidation carrier protein SoxY [Alphaproteobacteria bacterium]|nr:thiosulfate oxidation carrier protein SoxY [Alphaproteobacteria bacterium]
MTKTNDKPGSVGRSLDRRDFMITAASLGVGLTVAGALAPVLEARGSDDFKSTFDALVGNASPTEEKIKLEIDAYVENGNMVFYRLNVDHPMQEGDYVKQVHLLSTENPFAHVATFQFTPQSGRAAVAGRMRLAKTQEVVALAELSGDRLYIAKRFVKVAIGGCET